MQCLQVQLILALLCHGLQIWTQCGLGNRFGVIVILLLTLDERPDIDRRDNPRLKTQATQRAAHKVRTETRLHPDHTPWQSLEGFAQRETLDLLPQHQITLRIEPNQMKDVLAYVDADHRQVRMVFGFTYVHNCFSFCFR